MIGECLTKAPFPLSSRCGDAVSALALALVCGQSRHFGLAFIPVSAGKGPLQWR